MAYIEFIYLKNTKVNEKLLLENLFENITITLQSVRTVHTLYNIRQLMNLSCIRLFNKAKTIF